MNPLVKYFSIMNDIEEEIFRETSTSAGLGSARALYEEGRRGIKNLSLRYVKAFSQSNRPYSFHKATLSDSLGGKYSRLNLKLFQCAS